jgi:acyl-CoA thioester hydrolase
MDPELTGLLAGYPVVTTLPVQWGDQDSFQHVNNTAYFRWFESGRIAYSMKVGLSDLMREKRIGPILASMTCDYRLPLTFPDTVHVGTRITRIGRTSMTMEQVLVSVAARAVAAEGRSTLVVYDYNTAAPVPVPDAVHTAIAELEGKPV